MDGEDLPRDVERQQLWERQGHNCSRAGQEYIPLLIGNVAEDGGVDVKRGGRGVLSR